MEFRNRRAAGFVAGKGGRSSHAALIARSLMTPMAVVNNCWREISDGSRIILDGTNGVAIVDPSSDEWSEFQKKKRRQGPGTVTRIKKLTDLPPHTADGVAVNIAANLELPGPADEVLAQQKIPVGLYRTEFLYLENDDFPDEEMQYKFYRRVGEAFPHSTVTLRTFDLGADKMKGDGLLPSEDNPALGWRGIRSMLELPEIFKTQIRAMLRASAGADFRIMLPMISDIAELEAAKKLISQVKLELRRKKIPMAEDIPIGIMIEVPSAALTADELAQKCDFFSIGTNDLTQYTLSADRNNARVANLYNALHPSVLNLVRMTIEAGKRHGIPVAICGEIASDLLALPLLIGLNVSQLSMNPARIFDACRLVAKIDTGFLPGLVQSVLAARNVEQIRKALESYRDGLNKRKRSR